MSKQDLIDAIGKIFVDDVFRGNFTNNTDQTVDNISGLTPQEKQFLKNEKDNILQCVGALNISYSGENKGH
jgi:hypothetical protein